MLKLVFFVPQAYLEPVKQAVFSAGAGKIGHYEHCCWQVLGEGQFMPLATSNPYLGSAGKLEKVKEYRVEMVCEDSLINVVLDALREAHPYEEPAFDVLKLVSV